MATKHTFTPLQHFRRQRANASVRGIGWEFTFDQWWAAWQNSGKWDQRGNQRGQYVMARKGDAGPYSPGNVEIITYEQNCLDRTRNKPHSREVLANSLGKGRGWTRVGNRFQVTCAQRYVGLFKTQAEAEAAYAAAVAAALKEVRRAVQP